MSQFNTGLKAFVATEAITRYMAVKLATGTTVSICGSNEANIGFADETVASGETLTVKLKNAGGTFKAIANGTFSAAATLYNMADGEVDDIAGGTARYVALEAATAAGDIVEILPIAAY